MVLDCRCLPSLLFNTGRVVAENSLVEDGQDAAAGALSNAGAGGLEGGSIRGNVNGVTAVEVGDAENIGGTALSGAVEAGAGDVDLAVLHSGSGGGHGGHEGGDNSEELHFDGCYGVECW